MLFRTHFSLFVTVEYFFISSCVQGSLVFDLKLCLEELEFLFLQHPLMICNCLSLSITSILTVKEDNKEWFRSQTPLETMIQLAAMAEKSRIYCKLASSSGRLEGEEKTAWYTPSEHASSIPIFLLYIILCIPTNSYCHMFNINTLLLGVQYECM